MANKQCAFGKTWPTREACAEANPDAKRVKQCKCCKRWRPDNHRRKGDRHGPSWKKGQRK